MDLDKMIEGPGLDLDALVERIKPLHKNHQTLYGVKFGFEMYDITHELGSLTVASAAILQLEQANLLDGEFVVIEEGADALTLYRLKNFEQPKLN